MPQIEIQLADRAVEMLNLDREFFLIDRHHLEQSPVDAAVPASYLWKNHPMVV